MFLVYLAYKVHEINQRMKILDLRHRVLELMMGWGDERYFEAYDTVFGNLYVEEYKKLLAFSRRNDMRLPLKTLEEESLLVKRKLEREAAETSKS